MNNQLKKNKIIKLLLCTFLLGFSACQFNLRHQTNPVPISQIDIEKVYQQQCSSCHGKQRTGISAPALIPETLSKMKKIELTSIIQQGRPATQMPGFQKILSHQDIENLAQYLMTPTMGNIAWTVEDIIASRQIFKSQLEQRPVFTGDPWNLFFVVSHGDHGLSILDGDEWSILTTLSMRPGLHGGIKYTKDGRRAFAITRDGWLTIVDVYGLAIIGEVRIGINTRNIAISEDGKTLVAANVYPQNLVAINIQDLTVKEIINLDGSPSAIYTAFGRNEFAVGYKNKNEFLLISDDLKKKSSIKLRSPFEDFMFDPSYRFAVGTYRKSTQAQVLDLDLQKTIAEFAIDGLPHLGSGIAFTDENKKTYLVLPNMKEGLISFINTHDWKISRQVKTTGAGFFLRTHENTDYIFADSFMSLAKDELHVISKKNQKLVTTLIPFPGKTFAHTEFSKDGKFALASIWDEDGALIVIDSQSLKELKRIPMKKPSGKYNIYNKTHLSNGTSH